MKNLISKGTQAWNLTNVKFWCWKEQKKEEVLSHLKNNKGVGIVEIALIIVVIVALAFFFKKEIADLLKKIFDKVDIKDLEAMPQP